MSGVAPVDDPIVSLVDLANEHGHVLTRAAARSLCADAGFVAACEQVVMAARLVDLAARELRMRVDFDAAHGLYIRARRDFHTAAACLRDEAAIGRRPECHPTAGELCALAGELGVPISRSTARRYAADTAHDPRERVRELGRVRDAASRRGMRVDTTSAAARIGGARGDFTLAVARIERRAHNKRLLQSHLCRLRHRSGGWIERVDAAAWCKCSGCFYRLSQELEAYTRRIVAKHRRTLTEDLRQDAAEVLLNALLGWADGANFKAFYGNALANHLNGATRRAMAAKRGQGEAPLSLDASYATASGNVVTLADVVPDRSVDPLVVVLIKERIAEARAGRRHDAEQILILWETLAGMV